MNLSQVISQAKEVAPVVGIIGGILGFWSFIDNYLLMFKPKIFASSRVIFNFDEQKANQPQLHNVALTLEISNHRKKYGSIRDFAARIYSTDEVNPEPITYFSSDIAEKIELGEQVYVLSGMTEFFPIAVQPNSSKAVTVIFGGAVNDIKKTMLSGGNYYLELYYQKKVKSSWIFIDRLYLYNITLMPRRGQPAWNTMQSVFTTINFEDSRRRLSEENRKRVNTIYRGATHRQKTEWFNSFKYFFIRIWRTTKQMFFFCFVKATLAISWIFDQALHLPVIRKYNKNRRKINFQFGNPETKPLIEQGIVELKAELSKLINELNQSTDEERQISVRDEKPDGFTVSRYHMWLRIYISSDESIRVQEVNASRGKSKIRMTLSIKRSVFKMYYWQTKDGKIFSLRSFAIKILDFLVLHDGAV
jgi:hypothetical protein